MEKLYMKALLNHKVSQYEPRDVCVEKVVTLYGNSFEHLQKTLMKDNPYLQEAKDSMFVDDYDVAHCVLFVDNNTGDGILCDSEGSDYARKSQYISDAKTLLNANTITNSEWELHDKLKETANKIAEICHSGTDHFSVEDYLDNDEITDLVRSTVAEMLGQRDDMNQIIVHNLDIPYQPDLTVSAKPLETLRFVFPVEVQREPDYSEEYDILSSYEAGGYVNDINRKISEYAEREEEHRGLMTYYHENNAVNEKVYSAFPSVELRNGCLMGTIECQVTKDISEVEIKELKSYLLGQTSDGWGEGMEQQEISTDDKSIYCSFYTGTSDWEVERESGQDISEDNDMDMEM